MNIQRAKIERLELESPAAKYERLQAEKDERIEALRREFDLVSKEYEETRKLNTRKEKELKGLESKIRRFEPREEFVVKEAKRGKKARKAVRTTADGETLS